ncbi:hypothetical protein D3C81_858240 [compost metagenome]
MSGAGRSTAADTLPVGSRCSTVKAWPLVCGGSRVSSKVPSPATSTLPSTAPSGLRTITVAPGSPVPVTVVPLSSMLGLPTTCGGVLSGAVKSTGPALLPRLSVASTVRLSPLRCGGSRVTSKRPSAPTVAVPSTVPSAARTVTIEPLWPWPVRCRPALSMASPEGCSGPSRSGAVRVAVEVLPTASRSTTSSIWPSVWAGVRVRVKTPFAPTTAVPSTVPWASVTCTLVPGSPRPVRVTPSALSCRSLAGFGGVMSGAPTWVGSELLPPASNATTSSSSPLA